MTLTRTVNPQAGLPVQSCPPPDDMKVSLSFPGPGKTSVSGDGAPGGESIRLVPRGIYALG